MYNYTAKDEQAESHCSSISTHQISGNASIRPKVVSSQSLNICFQFPGGGGVEGGEGK